MSKRLIIVSNRIPVLFSKNEEDEIEVKDSDGGLVSALQTFIAKQKEFTEIVWVGSSEISPLQWDEIFLPKINRDYKIEPVFIDKKQYSSYYNGFANSVIWPLFHYFPSYCEFREEDFINYKKVNYKFFEKLRRIIRPNDTVWIHDYHLMILPGLLRSEFKTQAISFFLHVPFPTQELFRTLPKKWREEILDGLLGSDLIGFQTIDYLTHFLKTAKYVLNVDSNVGIIHYKDRILKADLFPISIDFDKFHSAYDETEVIRMRDELKEIYSNKKIIFSIDRLDYTKGILQRLKAYEKFLKLFPEYHETVVLIMIIIPSRDVINKYSERKKEIEEAISSLNGKLGNTHWQPIVYQYSQLSFFELIALYTCADVALITPMRDGMNLVAKEFVACRKDRKGVLILSEMTGAMQEMNDSISINPNDTTDIAFKIKQSLEMPALEQEKRITSMQKRISSYTVNSWGADFFCELDVIRNRQLKYFTSFLDSKIKAEIVKKYSNTHKRLILLDYDGTLRTYENFPEDASPGEEIINILKDLSADELNSVFVVSGRKMEELTSWFSGIQNLNLVSEHAGLLLTRRNEQLILVEENILDWKYDVKRIMKGICERCPDSTIEEKDFSLVWHYRAVSAELGEYRAMELLNVLQELTFTNNLSIQRGKKTIEIRPNGINKSVVISRIFSENSFDFVMAIGDDNTDEDMFKFLNGPNHYTIKVGLEPSLAKYHLLNPPQVCSFLVGLIYQSHTSSISAIQL